MNAPVRLLESLPLSRQIRVHGTLGLLREAREDAAHLQHDRWQFAVHLGELLASGATGTDLRWLLVHGLIEHALDQSAAADLRRSFVPARNLALSAVSAFVLSDLGASLAEVRPLARLDPPHLPRLPLWNADKRVLKCGDQLVKRFRVPAPSQETILRAFQEEDWTTRIDDPLPPRLGCDSHQRLHDAVRGLNRNQCVRILHFFRDGTGGGICWEAYWPESMPDGARPRIGSGKPAGIR